MQVETEGLTPQTPDDKEAKFSLVAGEGDGLMLGLAAGDAAGGAWELGYSAITEQATVIAYELIQHRSVDPDGIREALGDLDGSDDEEPVYRGETGRFREWLDRLAAGSPTPDDGPSSDGIPRATVVGVCFRKQADQVITETLALGRIFDRDAASLAASLIAATTAAASCFAQAGRDLITGVAEAVIPTLDRIGADSVGSDRLARLPDELEALLDHVGVTDGEEALAIAGGDVADPLQAVNAALLLVAPVSERFHGPVEQAARVGGSLLGAFAGAVMGARLGIKAWPWAFANDTWFAEIGRRLVRGPDDIEGLPIPYAVEQHLMFGPRPGFH
ncbi:MAG: ADP-ribosylglycohydrolase family protein [Actinobacteria bacterium]|nr:ADP-ribosylglycohydrolase family protein [Actinomycetota bacterium]MCI0542913.1 ADP-ribosylglycohydrolase family protein [Actinomycetota bacterium]MCI0679166.1 ADP-ribosylglycohydrolase family protein [Actinomycetota bacterium]